MARKKIETGSAEEVQKAELSNRIKQIRQILFDDNNRIYSQKIAVNEQALSQICSGKRNAGIEVVQRILENIPEISPEWLLLGKGERINKNNIPTPKPYDIGENGRIQMAADDLAAYGIPNYNDLKRENTMLYNYIKLLTEKAAMLESELQNEREKANSLLARMNEATISQ